VKVGGRRRMGQQLILSVDAYDVTMKHEPS
jgi:hypothetical protein